MYTKKEIFFEKMNYIKNNLMERVKQSIEATSLADALTQFCEQLTSTITHQVTESVREQLRTDRESRESREDGQIPKFLTVDEYCAQFHISKATFYRMVRQGLIKVTKKGRRTLIPADSL